MDNNMSIEELKAKAIAGDFYNSAAFELYELGEQEFALNILLNQFRKYKELENPRHSGAGNIYRITLIQIASLRDSRAIDDFIEVLGLYTSEAAEGLAMIGGDKLEKRLVKLASLKSMEGIGAIMALAYLEHSETQKNVIEFIQNYQDIYENIVKPSIKTSRDRIPFNLEDILLLIGRYDNDNANGMFNKYVNKPCIAEILLSSVLCKTEPSQNRCNSVPEHKFVSIRRLGADIAASKGWGAFIDDRHVRRILELDPSGRMAVLYSEDNLIDDLINSIQDYCQQ